MPDPAVGSTPMVDRIRRAGDEGDLRLLRQHAMNISSEVRDRDPLAPPRRACTGSDPYMGATVMYC